MRKFGFYRVISENLPYEKKKGGSFVGGCL